MAKKKAKVNIEPTVCRTGDLFTLLTKASEGLFILAQAGPSQVAMISLFSGNRWNDPIKVKKPMEITEDEFSLLCGYDQFQFVRLTPKEYARQKSIWCRLAGG